MKLNDAINMLPSNLLKEDLPNKNKSINIENNIFQNDYLLLKQEINRKHKEVDLWGQAEYKKLCIKHNQKITKIQIQ